MIILHECELARLSIPNWCEAILWPGKSFLCDLSDFR